MAANDFFVKTDGSQQKSQQIAKFANECANILSKKERGANLRNWSACFKMQVTDSNHENFISAKDSTDSTDSTDLKIKQIRSN